MKPNDTHGVQPHVKTGQDAEDAALLSALAEAYAKDEAAGASPEIERIAGKIRQKFEMGKDIRNP